MAADKSQVWVTKPWLSVFKFHRYIYMWIQISACSFCTAVKDVYGLLDAPVHACKNRLFKVKCEL